jgi:hypothetical protein
MERKQIKIDDLIESMADKANIEIDSQAIFEVQIDETLYGFDKKNLYLPIGKLQFPISIDIFGHGDSNTTFLGTSFNNGSESASYWRMNSNYADFLDEHCAPNLEGYFDEFFGFGTDKSNVKGSINLDSSEISKTHFMYTEQKGFNFETGLRKHIAEFIKLYDATKHLPATTENLQNIRNAFIDYRGN